MSAFEEVYVRLRQIMLDAAPDKTLAVDDPGHLILRTSVLDEKTGEFGWFGVVAIKKSYVAYHLMALYDDPSLAEGMSPALMKRRQGKTCFNFKKIDEGLLSELAALTKRADAR